VYGPVQSTGAAISWIAELLGHAATAADDGQDEHFADIASDRTPVFVPYLAGERAPIWRDDVRGLFTGLALEHRAADVLRAVELGIACADRDVLETTDSVVGERSPNVSIAGATATSARWRTLRAAVLGRPIDVLREPEASALGAAMLAACAAGESVERVGRQMRGAVDRLAPSEDAVRAGDAAFRRYRRAKDLTLEWAEEPPAGSQ
jgi:xylulokinase